MKKLIAIIGIALCGLTAQAQSSSTPAIDTLSTSSSADTVSLVSPANYFSGGDGTFSVALTAIKQSGTPNANVILQQSVDGTNYVNLECPCRYGTTNTTQDTVALANVATAQHFIWNCTGIKPKKVRLWIQAPYSTQAVQVKGYFIKR